MSQVTKLIKVVGAWVCIIAAAVCLFVAQPLVLPVAVLGIGFSQLPE